MSEEKTILTQKIRDPRPNNNNQWIEIFKIKENENKEPIIYTKSIITHNNMYKGGSDTEEKPVAADVIQDGAITNAAMYKITDTKIEELKTPEEKQLAQNKRPVSSDTIQDDAIVDSKIEDKTITMRKFKEPFFLLTTTDRNNDYSIILYCPDRENITKEDLSLLDVSSHKWADYNK